jgi:hypothetical protein
MAKRRWTRCAAFAVTATGLGIGGALLACHDTKSEDMERGVKVNDEVTMPESGKEMSMTEEERRAKAAAQDETQEQKEFNDSGQGDDESQPPQD